MTNLVRAKELLLHGDLLSSLDFFLKANQEDIYDDSEKLLILDSINEVSKSLEKEKSLYTLECLAIGFFELRQYQKSLDSTREAIKVSKKFSLFELQINNHKELGHVSELIEAVENFLRFLLKKRETTKSIELLDYNKNILPFNLWLTYRLKCFILMGDIHSLENAIVEIVKLSVSNKEEIIKMLEYNTLFWHKSLKIREWILETLTEPGFEKTVAKKYVIKLISDLFYHSENITDIILEKVLTISMKWNLFGLGYTVAGILKDHEKEDYFLSRLPNALISQERFDFGSDFISDSQNLEEHEYINKINFLESIGKKAEAVKERQIFQERFPSSNLLKNKVTKDNEKTNHNDINKTLDEISRRTIKNKYNEVEIEQHVSFESMDKNDLIENYSHITSNLSMLREYDKVVKLTETLLDKFEVKENIIDISYLKIEALIKLERYFEARDLAEKIILEQSLSLSEKCTFDYLLAECYFLLNEFEKAGFIYRDIYKNHKSYRLIENRLKYIEENK